MYLRRRGVATVVLAGVATNLGVGSTARQAYEHAYAVDVAQDATAKLSGELQAFAVGTMLPMLARVTTAG